MAGASRVVQGSIGRLLDGLQRLLHGLGEFQPRLTLRAVGNVVTDPFGTGSRSPSDASEEGRPVGWDRTRFTACNPNAAHRCSSGLMAASSSSSSKSWPRLWHWRRPSPYDLGNLNPRLMVIGSPLSHLDLNLPYAERQIFVSSLFIRHTNPDALLRLHLSGNEVGGVH